jgi:malate dehydrogenase
VDYATVSGIPIKNLLTQEQIEKIVTLTKTSGADVIELKGATTYAPAVVVAIMADAVLRGRNRVMSVSTFLQGEYRLSNISIGVPVILGKRGVEKILELRLGPQVEQQFKQSASAIQDMLRKLPE